MKSIRAAATLVLSIVLLAACGSIGCPGCPDSAKEAGFPARVEAPQNDARPATPPPR